MGKTPFFLFNWSLFNHAVKLHVHWFVQCYKIEPMARWRRWASLWLCSPPKPARMGGASGYISGRFAAASQISSLQGRRFFLADSSLTPRFAIETPQQLDWTSCSAQLTLPSLSPASIRWRPKRASQKSKFMRRSFKCRAVIVRRAGLPCTLMTVTLSVCHAFGEIPLWRCGADCELEWITSSYRSHYPLWHTGDGLPGLGPCGER